MTKTGDSLFISIPAHLAEKLGIEEGSTLFVEDQPHGFQVSPFPDETSLQMHIARQIMDKERGLLRRLAES